LNGSIITRAFTSTRNISNTRNRRNVLC
jgi:hypothetical protein